MITPLYCISDSCDKEKDDRRIVSSRGTNPIHPPITMGLSSSET